MRYYSTEDNSTVNVPEYDMQISESYLTDGEWNIIVMISSQVGGEIKDARVKVVVDAKTGKVNSFDPKV